MYANANRLARKGKELEYKAVEVGKFLHAVFLRESNNNRKERERDRLAIAVRETIRFHEVMVIMGPSDRVFLEKKNFYYCQNIIV